VSIAALRSNIVLFSLFLGVILTLTLLSIGFYRGHDLFFIRIAGGSGLAVVVLAWYDAFAKVWNHGNSWIALPMGTFPWAENGKWNQKRGVGYP
jgi:succinate-acetate transporter protein